MYGSHFWEAFMPANGHSIASKLWTQAEMLLDMSLILKQGNPI